MKKTMAIVIAILSLCIFEAHGIWISVRQRVVFEGHDYDNDVGNGFMFDKFLYDYGNEKIIIGEKSPERPQDVLFLYDKNGEKYAAFCVHGSSYSNSNQESIWAFEDNLKSRGIIKDYGFTFSYISENPYEISVIIMDSFCDGCYPINSKDCFNNIGVYYMQTAYFAVCTLSGWKYFGNSSSGICDGQFQAITDYIDSDDFIKDYGGFSGDFNPNNGYFSNCRFNKCEPGQYGNPGDKNGSCTACPIVSGVYTNDALSTQARYTSDRGARYETDCYLKPNANYYDNSGKFMVSDKLCTP